MLLSPWYALAAVDKLGTVTWYFYDEETPDFYILYQEGIQIAEFYVVDILESTTPMTLQDGANIFTMTASIGGVETAPSAPYVVNWPPLSYMVSLNYNSGGTVLPSESFTAEEHSDPQITATPNLGYHFTILDNGSSAGNSSPYTITDILADHALSIAFAIDTFTIATSAGVGGTVTCSPTTVNYGGSSACIVMPDAGYNIADVLVDESSVGAVLSRTFSNVTANHTIEAAFEIGTFAITASAGTGGTVSCSPTAVEYGGNSTCTITKDDGYEITEVTVDGQTVETTTNSSIQSNIGTFTPSTATFSLKTASETTTIQFGTSTDKPIIGDWDGNGTDEIGVFRPSTATFYLRNAAGTGYTTVVFGASTDLPIIGDWDGNGTDDIGVFRPSTATFYQRIGTSYTTTQFGTSTDKPIIGDWDGNGTDEIGTFTPSTATFSLKTASETTTIQFGTSTDKPIIGD
ncbi:MAG: hypothetical protein M0P97_04310, partial [Candidatus Moranbacteria bacterium]|nr:hypothetical protein [Candidatus Moranbacteria bacterium]